MSFEDLKNTLSIGATFTAGGGTYRVTDIGTRTIVAIRIDQVTVGRARLESGSVATTGTEVLDGARAEAEGWFNGPPYAVTEVVFDEDSYEVIRPLP